MFWIDGALVKGAGLGLWWVTFGLRSPGGWRYRPFWEYPFELTVSQLFIGFFVRFDKVSEALSELISQSRTRGVTEWGRGLTWACGHGERVLIQNALLPQHFCRSFYLREHVVC